MQYAISFLEGIVTFISPCLLPLLPLYVTYFAAGAGEDRGRKTLGNALGFVLGFTLVFVALGLFFGAIGGFLQRYATVLNLLMGALVILFGLSFIGVIRPLFGTGSMGRANTRDLSFWRALLFGMIFSISWTPCVGAFLGSALAMASASGSALQGTVMLLCFSAGLGIPFILSALLIDRLGRAFDWIKRHYKTINVICGLFLVIIGLMIMTGMFQVFLGLFGR